MPKKKVLPQLPNQKLEEFEQLANAGQELNEKAIVEEEAHRSQGEEGLPMFRATILKVYELADYVAQLSPDEQAALFSGQKYLAYNKDKPSGSEADLPYTKRGKENPAIPASKLILQKRDETTLSRVSTICAVARKKRIGPAEFDAWLMGEHRRGDAPDGEIIGRGYTNAYTAYTTRRKSADQPSSTTTQKASSGLSRSLTGVNGPDIEAVKRQVFAKGLTISDWSLRVPNEIVHHDVYSVLVKIEPSGAVTLVPEINDETSIIKRLSDARDRAITNPMDWAAQSSGPAKPLTISEDRESEDRESIAAAKA